ncbi:hypothetical protein WBP07_28110 [Novosphingobium sp. BL-8A]|uniref:hypothetical protein n=1 Tax=Novosphingobium sp. BL-8A TaxID=3127639 RepID=UPI0037580F47
MHAHIVSCLAVLLALSGCGKWEPKSKVKSPDGKAVAVVETKLSGASSSNRTRISLENAGDGKLLSPGEIVSADGAIVDQIQVAWVGPNVLSIALCEATDYQVRARVLRDPVTLPDGSVNAVSIKVENWQYFETQRACKPG